MLGDLPEDIRSSLSQSVERALAVHAQEASSDTSAILRSRVSALRRCFDDTVSRVLTTHNAKTLIVPDDVWPLVLEHLPLDDLLSASHTCRGLRTQSLAHSRLWTRLILHVDEGGSSSYSTNIGVLKNILPRARDHLLELDIQVSLVGAVEEYDVDIADFLELVAPRLVGLQMTSDVPRCVGRLLCECLCVFPELRYLSAPPSSRGCSGQDAVSYVVMLDGTSMPKLVTLDLHADLRALCSTPWRTLQILRCKCAGLAQIEDVLRSARGLRRLMLDWTYEWYSATGVTPPDAALVAALRAIPDVDITAELDPVFEDVVFDIFGCSPAPRLRLAFRISREYTGPLKPRPGSRLLSAVHLTLSVRGNATLIVPDDGSDRETVLSLRAVPRTNTLRPAVDWSLIPSFGALVHLSADAALWPDFMHNFPRCPRLSGITLAFRTLDDIQAVLAVDQQGLPQAESLNLMLEPDVELSEDQVEALMTAFGASQVALN